MSKDAEFARARLPGHVYYSKVFPERQGFDGEHIGPRLNCFAAEVFQDNEQIALAEIKSEVIIRVSSGGTRQIKALFYVDDRQIKALILQRFGAKNGKPHEQSFSFVGDEIDKLLEFAQFIATEQAEGSARVRIDIADLKRFNVSKSAAAALARQNLSMVAEIAESEVTERDVIAIGYRRKALENFRRFLDDADFFDAEAEKAKSQEAVWQKFFEANTWIFGYGLHFVFTSALTDRKLEQVVSGYNVASSGKRTDALLMTRGRISSLCFGEIKTHRTALLEKEQYRTEAWAPSREVVGAIAQVHRTVERAESTLRSKLELRDADGNPEGEPLFLLRPRSVVVVGNLAQFKTDHGINEPKYSSFELFRRQLSSPDVITFDELYERARFITECEADLRGIEFPDDSN